MAGYVTGIRFYKGAGNTGTHTGSLWNSAGTRLATVTFSGESATGWQQATFGAPVPVTANTSYVASYYAPVGRYSNNNSYFASAATTRGPLTALRNGTDGGNGLYRYGASGLPNSTYQSTNYWVDVVFDTTSADTTAPTVVAKSPAAGSDRARPPPPATATFSENVVVQFGQLPAHRTVRSRPGQSRLRRRHPDGDADPVVAPRVLDDLHGDRQRRPRRGRQCDGPAHLELLHRRAPAAPGPEQGPGGPIAVVTSRAANPYSTYLAEMLRTEGLNEFKTIDVGTLSASSLAAYDVVVLGAVAVTAAQATDLSTWVSGGGNLIAIKPSSHAVRSAGPDGRAPGPRPTPT